MNSPVDFGLSILEISKITMHGFWYDYIKAKYNKKVKLCYMKTLSMQHQKIFRKTLQKVLKKVLYFKL